MEETLQLQQTERKKGLSTAALKWIALGLMVLDHIHYFFGFTGWVPEAFTMLGRLSANLFLFCVVEGFAHTHDRKRYFLRIWAIGAAMGAVLTAFMFVPALQRPDGFYPYNGVLLNFVILLPMLQGVDWLRQKRFGRGLAALLLPLAWPVLISLGAGLLPLPGAAKLGLTLMGFTVLPMWNFINDGGLFFILTGLLLYLCRGHKWLQAGTYVIFTMLVWFVRVWLQVSAMGEPLGTMFTQYYEWFSVFSVLFMLCYNGQKGKGGKISKHFFYVFYPAHIYILYALSWGLYLILQ